MVGHEDGRTGCKPMEGRRVHEVSCLLEGLFILHVWAPAGSDFSCISLL